MTVQRTFASGEVSPSLYGRVDVERWRSALQTCRNCIVQPEGGITDRQGFEHVYTWTVADADDCRFLPFEFGPDDSYALTIVEDDMYVIRNGAIVLDDGTSNVYSLPTTFAIANTKWVQSGDTIYIVDGVNRPQKLVREELGWEGSDVTRHDNWTLDDAPVTPTIPTGVTVSLSGGSGSQQSRYRVTYTDRDGIESGVMRSSEITGTASLSGGLWNIAYTAHGLLTNDNIEITEDKSNDAGDLVYKAGDLVRVVKVDNNNFTVAGDTSAVSGNFKYRKLGDTINNVASSSNAITVTWTLVSNAEYYNVYREYGRWFSYIGSTSGATFTDYGVVPDAKDNPAVGIDPVRSLDGGVTENIPSAVGLFQERLLFGGYSEDIERITASAVGNYSLFDPTAEDASGLDFGLAGKTVNNIKHMVEIAGRAVVLTSTAEWVLRGSATTGALTPTAINARVDSYHGSSDVVPAVVGSSLLFVQKGGRILRDARYDYSQEALASRDLTLWAKHLFEQPIKRVCYQRSEEIVWVLLEDGSLRGLTYVPDQDVWGWHRHDIGLDYAIKDIVVVSEDNRDRLYVLAAASSTKLVAMRLPLSITSDQTVDDHVGFDDATVYDGRYAATGTLTGGTNWTTDETLTLTASASSFTVGDVGDTIALYLGEERVYVEVTAYTSGTVVSCQPTTVVPDSMQGVACEMAMCVTTLSVGTHLNSQEIGYIADGSREADVTVSAGSITLAYPAGRVQAGVPIACRAQTLDLESTEKDSLMGDFRHVVRVRLRLVQSRSVKAGLSETTLEEVMPTYNVTGNAPPSLQDGVHEILMDSAHDEDGSIIIAQDDGMPMTVTNIRALFNPGDES